MSDSFKSQRQIEIREESRDVHPQIRDIDIPTPPQIRDYELPRLRDPGAGRYAAAKARYGALAATDPDRTARAGRDARFSVNPLLRDPLGIAEEERRQIEARVEAAVAARSDEARQVGLREGYAAGEVQARQACEARFREESASRMERLEALIAEFEGLRSRLWRENERFLLETVNVLVRRTVLRELRGDADHLKRLATQLVESAGARDRIRIRVSPDDLALAGELRAELAARLGDLRNLSIEADDEIRGGGCRVETDWNAVDASLETQLERIEEELLREHRE